MSRTWDLRVPGLRDSELLLSESGLTLMVSIAYPFGDLGCELSEDDARDLRDWLSWYLDEGPEPGEAS